MNKAFTLLELVFVILILGILSSLSLSFINTTKDEVKILKLKMDYEMLSSALALMRSQNRFALNAKEMVEFIYDSKEGLLKCIGSSRCKDLI
ncbi:TPA: prepilin-type N-terminal cleavage/methylation domain-containing protein [Campylobacter jejuni]|nr:prepilin-type N-terminal cleavage/methylation domain-containing protein [Campylobacter jejuni]